MGKRSKKAQEAYDIAKPVADQMGFDLVDAEYKKEGQSLFLRLFIDKKGGIAIDECEAFSQAVDPLIEANMTSDADYFEVSSPGLTRPLEEISDYIRYMGEKIEFSLFAEKDGYKSFIGVVKEAGDSSIEVEAEDGNALTLELSDIAKAVRHIEF